MLTGTLIEYFKLEWGTVVGYKVSHGADILLLAPPAGLNVACATLAFACANADMHGRLRCTATARRRSVDH